MGFHMLQTHLECSQHGMYENGSILFVLIMSKKNNKPNQQSGSKEEIIQLSSLTLAKRVVIRLPASLQQEIPNQSLVHAYLRNKLKGKKIQEGHTFVTLYLGKENTFVVTSIETDSTEKQAERGPSQKRQRSQRNEKKEPTWFVVNDETSIVLQSVTKDVQKENPIPSAFYGYREELNDLKQTILHTLYHREQLIESGLGPLKGILVSGFSGAGKSAILAQVKNMICQKEKIYWKGISSVQMLSRVVGGAEEFIRNTFAQLKEKSPAVLTIEDIHLLFGAKEVSSHETVLATLLGELDKIVWEEIVVVATYNTDRELSKSIRSSGKFQKEININLPNHFTRLQILKGLFSKIVQLTQQDIEGLKKINLRLNGFSVGEIKQILREAYAHWGKELSIQKFGQILKKFRPTEIKELIVEVPEVYWTHIGGYQSVKKQIKKVVELPLTHASKFARFGIQPSKGILLYGPPGCSKTMMAKAIATESKLNFISIKGPQLFSKYVGQSERAIRNIFKRARACSPCVIFFDQIDALASQRSSNTDVTDRVLCQLLNEMDGIQGLKEVAIVAATNRPEILDKALMRPGRFDYLIYVSPPDETARKDIFSIYLSKSVKGESVKYLSEFMASKTQDYTGAEISLVCREAVMIAMEANIECEFIEQEHLEAALRKVRKRLTRDLIMRYEQFSSSLKQ